jgi:cell wall-associated NlpC family hydrolase
MGIQPATVRWSQGGTNANAKKPRIDDGATASAFARIGESNAGGYAAGGPTRDWSSMVQPPANMGPYAKPGQPLSDVGGMGPYVTSGPKVSKAIDFAKSQLGDPYVWGAGRDLGNANPSGFDCSGLTYWAFGRAGIKLGATADAQFKQVPKVQGGLANAKPGDLVFYNFGRLGAGRADHVAIYLGNNQILHAPNKKSPVKIATMTPGYASSIIGVGRAG